MRLDLDVFGDKQISRELLRFGDRADDMTGAFRELADDFEDMEAQQFNTQGVFSGGWAPLKPSTIEAKMRKGHDPRIMHATLALRLSLTQRHAPGAIRKISRDELVLGTSVKSDKGFPYPAAHQNPQKGQTRRRVIELTPARRRDWMKVLQRHLVGSDSVL